MEKNVVAVRKGVKWCVVHSQIHYYWGRDHWTRWIIFETTWRKVVTRGDEHLSKKINIVLAALHNHVGRVL